MYEDKTYETILSGAKKEVGSGVNVGEGYLVYNALSALAYEAERIYIQMDYIINQSHAETADLDGLIDIAKDRSVYHKTATNAEVKIVANCPIPIGSRFSLKSFHYIVTEAISEIEYTYKATCEEAGAAANYLTGVLTAIDHIQNLEKAEITEILINGEDEESKEKLYARYLQSFATEAFGGNIAEYKEKINAFPGVGGCKIYPVWDGPGTVRAAVISSENGPCSDYLIAQIQEAAMPQDEGTGYGFAPIDHDVTIESVQAVTINIAARITYNSEYSLGVIIAGIKNQFETYLKEIAGTWADGDHKTNLIVYVSKLQAAALDVDGVNDISETTLNGGTSNIALGWDRIPVMGEVVIDAE